MATIRIKGQEVRVGDDYWYLGTARRITRIEDYVHPVVTRNEVWRFAYSDGPTGTGRNAWGITLEYDHGHAAGCEVTWLYGDDRGRDHVPADDYLDPFTGTAAGLWARYEAEGKPGLWRTWVTRLPLSDMPGLFSHESGEACYNLTCFTGIKGG